MLSSNYPPYREVNGSTRAQALANISTLNLGPRQRSIGRVTYVEVDEELKPATHDLLADLFHSLYQTEVEPAKNISPERIVNARLLDWLRQQSRWDSTRSDTRGSLFASVLTTSALLSTLTDDKVWEEIIKEQEKLERERKKIEQTEEKLRQEIEEHGENSTSAKQARKKLDNLKSSFNASAEELQNRLDKIQESPLMQAKLSKAVRSAQDIASDARDTESMLAGWGSEDGENSQDNLDLLLKFTQENESWIKSIARIVGRAKAIALRAGRESSLMHTAVTEASFTKNLAMTFPDQLAQIAPSAPPVLRALKVAQYANTGLLGWKETSEKEYKGSFAAEVDISGSMMGMPSIIARGVAWGIAQAFKESGRHYYLASFGTRVVARTDDTLPFADQMRWLSSNNGGGTDFNKAFDDLTKRIMDYFAKGLRGIDALFLTDGFAVLDKKQIDAWREAVAVTGARLLYVAIGAVNNEIASFADHTIQIKSLTEKTGDEIASQLGTWMGYKKQSN